jgi:hypothetical protein
LVETGSITSEITVPDRQVVLIGDGAYAANGLLGSLDPRVQYVGRMRGDAEIYDPQVPPQPSGKGCDRASAIDYAAFLGFFSAEPS